jgi:ribonuclease HII
LIRTRRAESKERDKMSSDTKDEDHIMRVKSREEQTFSFIMERGKLNKHDKLNTIAGVDEAGRGSVIGPLVVCAVAINATKISMLKEIGVRDSKLLSATARDRLYDEIINIVDEYAVCIVEPKVIDAYVNRNALNMLEAKMFAQVIAEVKPSLAYIDACDINPARFTKVIASSLSSYKLQFTTMLSASHKADKRNVLVGAASIIAKVTRDKAIERLKSIHGDFGSGYPSDAKTIRFINHMLSKGITLECIRYSWKPVKILMSRVTSIQNQNSFYYLPLYY